MFSRSWLLAAAFVAGGSVAQTAAQSAAPDPAPLKYESTFTGYQPYRDGKRGDWRELNETVGVLGGHNAHLRSALPVVNSQGTVVEIDKPNARVRIDHEAIRELGWPAATAFWSLKDAALADKIKPGERIGFRLELAGDSYKIANVGPAGAPAPMPGMPPGHKM